MKKIIFALILLILIPATVLALNDCPYNKTDCFFPGECIRYIDTDNDKICDYSQIAAENNENISDKQSRRIYHLLPISLFLIILYAITRILLKKKIISIINHRKIWNILLLATFLISGLLGILLIIKINLGITIPLPFNMLFWHVEIGIAMFIICVFHTIEHWYCFKNLLKSN